MMPPAEVRRALHELAEHGAVERAVHDEGGRLREVWRTTGTARRPAQERGEDGVEKLAGQRESALHGLRRRRNGVLA